MKKKILFPCVILLSLCSCGETIKGSWHSIVATQDDIITTINTTVPPFNTVMNLNYFLYDDQEDKNDEILNQVTSIYNSEVSRLHKIFDRHYYYKAQDDYSVDVILCAFSAGEMVEAKKEFDKFMNI